MAVAAIASIIPWYTYFLNFVLNNIHFENTNKTLELHILDLKTDDFYGKVLTFTIIGFTSRMGKFANTEELVESINKDIIIAIYNLN